MWGQVAMGSEKANGRMKSNQARGANLDTPGGSFPSTLSVI